MQTAAKDVGPSGYRALAQQIRTATLLERRPWSYVPRIALTIGVFLAGWFALFAVGDSWAALGIAVLLGFASTHVVFIGHEAGHQQIFISRRTNWMIGLVVGNVLSGLSFGWWVPKHNAHHTYLNQVGRDPDISPVSAVEIAPVSRIGRYLSKPLLLLEVGMHLSSMKTLARRRDHAAAMEWLLLAVNATVYLTVVFWVLSPLRAVAFIAIQQGFFGLYLRLCFALNHRGMPIIGHDTGMGFVERQVITTRNLTGGRFTSFMLGGLNFQIEHHLFPTMPRVNLVQAQTIVRVFCADNSLDYREDSLFDSYRQAFRFLRTGVAADASTQRLFRSTVTT